MSFPYFNHNLSGLGPKTSDGKPSLKTQGDLTDKRKRRNSFFFRVKINLIVTGDLQL